MKIIAVICARGGSRGVPKKNIRPLLGRPLIAHTIDLAKKCPSIDRVIVSTEDPEIAGIAGEYGAEVPFIRPEALAQDSSPKLPVLQHAVNYLQSQENYHPDIIVDLDPTSPLRTVEDVETCIRMVREAGTDNVFSVTQSRRNPYFNMVEVVDGRVKLVKSLNRPVAGRQDAPPVYDMNASIYAWKRAALMDNATIFLAGTRIYEMPEWALDIDSELDFEFAEFILSKRGK